MQAFAKMHMMVLDGDRVPAELLIDALGSLAQRPDVQAIREPQRAVAP